MNDFALNAIYALVVVIAVLGLLIAIAAPVEAAARRSVRFADALDRFVDRIFG